MKGMNFTVQAVRAIRDGRKRQTRQPLRPQPTINGEWVSLTKRGILRTYRVMEFAAEVPSKWAPYQPGQIIYARERWRYRDDKIIYEVDGSGPWNVEGWRSGPPSAAEARARYWLRISDVCCQRLQEITKVEALEEGMIQMASLPGEAPSYVGAFYFTWRALYGNGQYGWDKNPWVWRYEFMLLNGKPK